MINVEQLLKDLKKKKIDFFTGVPDSILKNFSKKIENFKDNKHKIAVSEGSAVAIGIGYYLATKKIPCVYMQNSGLGNAINPLISIAHKKVYSIPLLLLIGWRGSPKHKDEPQHMVKGKITQKLLRLLNINFCILEKESDLKKLSSIIKKAKKEKKVVACLVCKNVLKISKHKAIPVKKNNFISRKNLLIDLLKLVKKNSKIISTTGYTSRELMQIRKEMNLKNGKDFYMVGGMGHSMSVAIGMNLQTQKQIICIDGDGSMLMHLGSLFTGGFNKKINIKYILLNNNSHQSVGGQKTNADKIDFKYLSKSLGYKNFYKINNKNEIKKTLKTFLNNSASSFLEAKINAEVAKNLPRPDSLLNIKNNFIK